MIAVWGPAGAPGRTTLAAGLAAELARRRLRTVLVDADPYGGAVAQQLGILDEVSGPARGGPAGRRRDSSPSGSPRCSAASTTGSRSSPGCPVPTAGWRSGPGAVEHLLEVARGHGHVVVDTGFSLEEDPASDFGSRPGRNRMTLGALEVADEVVVVGTADPVGLSRLARALVELRDLTGGAPARVVVNRMRPTLGWSEKDIAGMVAGFARLAGLHFLPDDRAAVDRALVAGRTLAEAGDSRAGPGRRRARGRPRPRERGPGVTPARRAGQAANSRYSPPTVNATIANSSGSWPVSWCRRRQDPDRAVVGRDHADHVAEHDGEHLDGRQQRRVVGQPVVDAPVAGAEQVAAVAERVAGLDQGLLADLDEVGQVVRDDVARR